MEIFWWFTVDILWKVCKSSSFNGDFVGIYIFLLNRNKLFSPIFQFDFNSLIFFKLAILFLSQRYFHFFYIIKISLYCIIKRASLYIGSISSGTVNSLIILIFGFLLIDVNSFVFISTIAFYYPLIRSIWFGYKIYSLRPMILTININ